MQWSAATWRSANPIRPAARTSGVQQDVASGAAGGFVGRQPVAADGEWLRSVTPTARHALLPPCRRVTNLN
jgi:hypothetical protein